MAEVLVVAELVEGAVTKPTCELVTLARRLGDPVVVVLGDGAEAAAAKVGEYGATRVLSVTDPAIDDYLVAPKAEALAQVAESVAPAAVLLTLDRRGQGDRRPTSGQARLRPDHRCDRHRRRRDHHPVGVCRQLTGSPRRSSGARPWSR